MLFLPSTSHLSCLILRSKPCKVTYSGHPIIGFPRSKYANESLRQIQSLPLESSIVPTRISLHSNKIPLAEDGREISFLFAWSDFSMIIRDMKPALTVALEDFTSKPSITPSHALEVLSESYQAVLIITA